MSLKKLLLVAFTAGLFASNAVAQDIHFTQFNMAPLTINPAFTGYHSGLWRANAIYRNQWATLSTPFVTLGASVDAPIYRNKNTDNYLAGGLNLFSDKSGDGNLLNNTVMGSLAYHMFLGKNEYDGSRFNPKSALSFGMQAGFSQKSIDLARLYFSDEFRNGGYNFGTTQEILNNRLNSLIVNSGVNYALRVSKGIGIQAGASIYNINQPLESFNRQVANKDVGLAPRINMQLGADIKTTRRLYLLPAFLYQTQANASEMIGGLEVNYALGETPEVRSTSPKIFAGYYNRLGDAHAVNGGIEYNGFRLGVAYDKTYSLLANSAANVGSMEIALGYIAPNPLDAARRIFLPCSRF
jgi:type IX secretion system PorP/SprF family membrane protein